MVKKRSVIAVNGCVDYYPHFLSTHLANDLFHQLKTSIDWKQYPISLFGKTYMQPRLIAWNGDAGISYQYSQTNLTAQGWHPATQLIKEMLEEHLGLSFNSVLLNLYRDGQDSMGWHSDDEKALGNRPVIASVSLGAQRKMHFRQKKDKKEKKQLFLENGSLLLMKGDTQHYWQHQIPKTTKCPSPRINLTFRTILT